jgi:hypothetical protein
MEQLLLWSLHYHRLIRQCGCLHDGLPSNVVERYFAFLGSFRSLVVRYVR